MKVRFKTFGCRLNKAESLDLEARFAAAGWTAAEHSQDADLVVVRACSVTSAAQRECEKYIARLKALYPAKRIVVTGCTASRSNEFLINALLKDGGGASAARGARPQPVPVSTARAWLKVQDGCNSKCAFCIVPQFRSSSASVPFDDAVDRAKRFVEAGYREIVVTGCNLAQYSSGGRRLPELVEALCSVGGCRIRLGSVEPGAIAGETVSAMAASPAACRFLHLSVQSGSDRILAAMKRPYFARDVRALAAAAQKAMPGIALGCDMIAGFPGESEYDHFLSRQLLEDSGFTAAHVFPYSTRPGTAAAVMSGGLPREVRSARARDLSGIAEKAKSAFAAGFRGKTVEIVVEDAETTAGWTSQRLWCEVSKGYRAAWPGGRPERKSLAKIAVRSAKGGRLCGVPA